MTLLNIILRQNYFSFLDRIYQLDKGVAMGSPISGNMAEVFLQQLENSIIKHLTDAKILSFYTRYVDDIFLIYDSTRTNPDNFLLYVHTIHGSIQLNPTMETTKNVNFLDLSINTKPTCLGISIFRKPSSTDTTPCLITRLNIKWQPIGSSSEECSHSRSTKNNNIKNGNTYYTLHTATKPP